MGQFPQDSVTAGHPTTARSDDHEAVESDRRMATTFLRLIFVSIPVAAIVVYFGTAGRRAAVRQAMGLQASEPAVQTQPLPAAAPQSPAAPLDADAPDSGCRQGGGRSRSSRARPARRPAQGRAAQLGVGDCGRSARRATRLSARRRADARRPPRSRADGRRRRRHHRDTERRAAKPIGPSGQTATARLNLAPRTLIDVLMACRGIVLDRRASRSRPSDPQLLDHTQTLSDRTKHLSCQYGLQSALRFLQTRRSGARRQDAGGARRVGAARQRAAEHPRPAARGSRP